MSKTDCLSADWNQLGHANGLKGNADTVSAFNVRKENCAKHEVTANWEQFKHGHADGIVEFCQLINAVKLGARGAHHAIDNRVCLERDYPGFNEAFGVGYKLHALNSRVRARSNEITDIDSRIYRSEQKINLINRELSKQEVNRSNINQLQSERSNLRNRIYRLNREREQHRWRLHEDQSARSSYSAYVYQDYITSLNDQFVDPRQKKALNDAPPPRNTFEERVDEILR